MRSALLLVLAIVIAGCATLPEVTPWTKGDAVGTPRLVGARGPLTDAQVKRVITRLQKQGASDLLTRHLAIEEEIAGQPLTVGNAATVLRDGPRSYRAMFEAIERARDHINVEFYIIEDDEVGRRFADALLKKSAEGVAVNLMYDSVGSGQTPPAFFDRLREGGVNVLEYNPVNPLRARGEWRVNNRNHRKLVVVDGAVAFTGGINISGVYSSGSGSRGGSGASGGGSSPGSSRGSGAGSRDSRRPGWRDTNVRIEGPAVAQMQAQFLETWARQGGPPLPQRNWYPTLTREGDHPVRIVDSGPREPAPAIYVAILSAMAQAEKSIHVTMAYFVPDPQTMETLKNAARRGVDVTLVLPSYTDFWAVFHAGRSHYTELLEAGVKIYERQEALLHAKTIVIDGVWSTVGSSNLDWRSFLHNAEMNAVILGWDFGQQMEAMFQDDVRGSRRIDLDSWQQRPMSVRMKEWTARFWAYWL